MHAGAVTDGRCWGSCGALTRPLALRGCLTAASCKPRWAEIGASAIDCLIGKDVRGKGSCVEAG